MLSRAAAQGRCAAMALPLLQGIAASSAAQAGLRQVLEAMEADHAGRWAVVLVRAAADTDAFR